MTAPEMSDVLMPRLQPWPRQVVVLGAGGVASTVLLHWLAAGGTTGVGLLSCDLGEQVMGLHRAAATAQGLGCEHRVADLAAAISAISTTGSTVRAGLVEVSNGLSIALALAVGWAITRHADVVLVGVHGDDAVLRPEAGTRFLSAVSRQAVLGNITLSAKRFEVRAPFAEADWSSAQVVQLGHQLHVRWDRTWSCRRDGPTHCGRCSGCRRRRGAFTAAGIADPTEYGDHGPAGGQQ